MQKMALLVAVLSLGAGCASQGTGMSSTSGSGHSSNRSWMNADSHLSSESMHRDASGSVVIQTPSTASQFDPAMSSTDLDTDVDLSMDSDRSLDSNLDLSAAGSAAGNESGASFNADVDVDRSSNLDVDADVDTSVVDVEPTDDLHSGSSRWSDDGLSQSDSRRNFEEAIATDSVDEASGRPADVESSSASGSVHLGDSEVKADLNSGTGASVDVDTSSSVDTSADLDVNTSVGESERSSINSDIKADSSLRGGSDRVRNVPLRDMETETPRIYSEEDKIKADSSLRGGSDRVRNVPLRDMDQEHQRGFNDKNRIKADSSVRGASAQARGTDRLWMSGNQPADVPTGRVTSNEPDWLHKSNPAHGTPAPAAIGSGSAFDPNVRTSASSGSLTGAALADRVKQVLVKENSGTGGMLSKEIARNVKVTNRNGTIVLTGSVPDEKSSKLIEIRAAEVRGVKDVENRLTINHESLPAHRNDDQPSLNVDVERR